MLGSVSEADDAVQDAWLRLSRSEAEDVEDLRAWLTTVVARLCLNRLRSRKTRPEASLETRLPDPIVSGANGIDPEHEALIGDGVGLALQIVLDTLSPAERLAFVLHDVFAVPFNDIAPIVGRSPEAAKMLASRARRRVRAAPLPDVDLAGQWAVADAFLAAARDADFDRLLAVLDPDAILRADGGVTRRQAVALVRGAHAVAAQTMNFRSLARTASRVLVNGNPAGLAWSPDGSPFALVALTVRGGRIAVVDVYFDRDRLRGLDLASVVK
jgi:RNA polymerase sigma-70 factor (ECF subfamily)